MATSSRFPAFCPHRLHAWTAVLPIIQGSRTDGPSHADAYRASQGLKTASSANDAHQDPARVVLPLWR